MTEEVLVPYLNKTTDPKLHQLRVSIYNQMVVHTRGLLPIELLNTSRPNEPTEVKKYRIDTYQPITRDPIIRALNSTYHLIKQSDYKIVTGEKTAEYLAVKKFESYISTNKLALVDLMFRSYLQLDIEDPNGVIFWKAVHPTDRNIVPNDLPKTAVIDIESEYISSERLVFVDDNVLIYASGEVLIDKQPYPVFIVVNDTDIYRNVPTRKDEKGKMLYELQPYYKHDFGFIPYMVLGGIETLKQVENRKSYLDKNKYTTYRLFDSYFTAYNSWGNKTIIAWSECDAVKVMSSFPIVEIADTVCSKCKGQGTILPDNCRSRTCGHENGGCSNVTCTDCKGMGTVSAFSPYSVIKRKPLSGISGDTLDTRPTVQYFMPPLEAVEVNKVYAFDMFDKAEQSLAIYETRNEQSGVAKDLDLEQKRDQISVLADNIMNIYEFSLRCISAYLKDTVKPHLIKPTRYEIRNKDSIIEEIKNVAIVSKDLSKALMLEYIEKEYMGDELRAMQLLISNDDYFGWSSDDLAKEKAMQLLDETMFKFHRQGFNLLSKIIKEDVENTLTDEAIIDLVYSKLR